MAENIQGRKFPPVGRCIYCGSDGGDTGLRSEHFLPEALGGKAELLGSSCAACEAKTSYLDGYLARRTYYDYRLHKGVVGKKRKLRHPTELPVTLTYRSDDHEVSLPVESRPYFTVLPVFRAAGILRGAPPFESIEVTQAHAFHYIPPDLRSRVGVSNDEPLAFKVVDGNLNVTAFARALAKIGFGAAVAVFGFDSFDPLGIREVILGREDAAGYYVGGVAENAPPPPDKDGRSHWINFEEVSVGGRILIIAVIRLFANSGTQDIGMPIYEVVVGERWASVG